MFPYTNKKKIKIEDKELKQLSEKNPCQSQSELANLFALTQQAISKHLHNLGRIQKALCSTCAYVSLKNKERRLNTVISPSSRFKKKDFLHKFVTDDEK